MCRSWLQITLPSLVSDPACAAYIRCGRRCSPSADLIGSLSLYSRVIHRIYCIACALCDDVYRFATDLLLEKIIVVTGVLLWMLKPDVNRLLSSHHRVRPP